MNLRSLILAMTVAAATAFLPSLPTITASSPSLCAPTTNTEAAPLLAAVDEAATPPLRRNPPRDVALLVEPTPFTHVSGYANRFKEMLRYLAEAGDRVEILTVDAKTPKEDLPTEAFGYPIQHTQGFTWPLYNHISLTFDLPEMKGAKMMERRRPDLLHVTSPGFLLFAGLFYARVLRIPLLLSYHTNLVVYSRIYLKYMPGHEEFAWFLLRFVHNRADLTLVTSPQVKEEMEAHGIKRVEVWRKGIDTVRFQPRFASAAARERMTDGHPEDFLIVHVGRLGAEKRLKDLRPVLEQLPEARLCIVGTGPYEEELKKYFAGTRTVFTGQLSGDELSSAYASGDMFIMPSDSETLGFVVLESMASGVPVVGCAAGGIPDLIRDGDTSFLVPTGDIDGYVRCARQLIDDAPFRKAMGKRARAEAEKWGWEAATSVLRNVQYEKAMINFHSRAFGGFGASETTSLWRLLRMRIARVMGLLRIPGFRRNRDVASPI